MRTINVIAPFLNRIFMLSIKIYLAVGILQAVPRFIFRNRKNCEHYRTLSLFFFFFVFPYLRFGLWMKWIEHWIEIVWKYNINYSIYLQIKNKSRFKMWESNRLKCYWKSFSPVSLGWDIDTRSRHWQWNWNEKPALFTIILEVFFFL